MPDALELYYDTSHGHRSIFADQRQRKCGRDAHHYLQQYEWLRIDPVGIYGDRPRQPERPNFAGADHHVQWRVRDVDQLCERSHHGGRRHPRQWQLYHDLERDERYGRQLHQFDRRKGTLDGPGRQQRGECLGLADGDRAAEYERRR
jgi:hypothetical protein